MNCFNFSVGGEALWWKPCIEPFHYGEIQMDGGSLNEQLTLCPDYKWGWRVFANLADYKNCRFVDGEWAHVKGKTRKTKSNIDGLTAFTFSETTPPIPVDTLKAVIDVQYDKAGGKGGLKLFGNDCTYLYGYLGGRWIRIEVEQESIFDNIGSVNSCTLYHGGAFEVGIGGRANILCDFGASFRLGLLAPIVNRKHTFIQQIEGTIGQENCFSDPVCCKGGFELRGGINFIAFRRCGWVKVEAGYELDYYFKALLREQPTINNVNVVAENFGIGGPYVGITVGF